MECSWSQCFQSHRARSDPDHIPDVKLRLNVRDQLDEKDRTVSEWAKVLLSDLCKFPVSKGSVSRVGAQLKGQYGVSKALHALED